MKKMMQLLIITLLMFIGINGVKAEEDPTYFGECTVKSNDDNTCVYECTLKKDPDYYINSEYTVELTKKGDLKHSIKIIDSNDDSVGLKSLNTYVTQEDEIIKPLENEYYLSNQQLKCKNVKIEAISNHTSHSSANISSFTYYRKYTISSVEEDSSNENIVSDNSVCGLLGGDSSKTVKFLKKIYGYVKIAIPVLIILLGITDFVKVVASGKDDDMKKAIDKFAKRVILAVVFILVPIIISLLINLSGLSSQYDALNDGVKSIFCILG